MTNPLLIHQRFQNYQATFTVLNTPVVKRRWLQGLSDGKAFSESAPDAWTDWVQKGSYQTGKTNPHHRRLHHCPKHPLGWRGRSVSTVHLHTIRSIYTFHLRVGATIDDVPDYAK
ncbi:MAG: hypothetical protein GY742_19375 [Hyphomicrobiales bacterium]|nr:hypothetical protein [Hyphomicrobiales bacterium]